MISDFTSSKIFVILVMGILLVFILLYAKCSRTCVKYRTLDQDKNDLLKLINVDPEISNMKSSKIDKSQEFGQNTSTKESPAANLTQSKINNESNISNESNEKIEPMAFNEDMEYNYAKFE